MNQNQHDDSGNETRKRYVKPEIKKVDLTPVEAVLGGCKVPGTSGSGQPTCHAPSACSALTS